MSTSPQRRIRFDPIIEICRNQPFLPDEKYVCVFTHGELVCDNLIQESCKIEAEQLAKKIVNQPAKDISWADLWIFITAVHCVHHFDEAIKFELPYSLDMLVMKLKEQEALDVRYRRCEEWEAELRKGEAKEDARRRMRFV